MGRSTRKSVSEKSKPVVRKQPMFIAPAHTPAPWSMDPLDGQIRIFGGIFPGAVRAVVEIADVWSIEAGKEVQIANATLIAAAPDLLAALKRLSFTAQTSGGVAGRDEELVEAIDVATRTIAKAEGK